MQIHIQNEPGDTVFEITPTMWGAACDRAGEPVHSVTFGTSSADFIAGLSQAEAVVSVQSGLRRLLEGARTLPPAPRLKILSLTSAGLDKLAPFDWLPPGLVLLNNRGAHGAKVAEFARMALLMLGHRLPRYITQQRQQVWQPEFTPILRGQTVVVIGTGDLGSAAGQQARACGMRTIGVNTRATPNPAFDEVASVTALDSVLARADHLVLACPLTNATRGLIDRRRLALLPRGAGLLNVGRGALLDHDALCDALETGALSGAFIDVTLPEPPPPDHRLWSTPNLVITPHCAADDPDTYNPVSLDIFFTNLHAWRAGARMPNQVDPARGY